jgi:rhodanese-related sulfurtransferase
MRHATHPAPLRVATRFVSSLCAVLIGLSALGLSGCAAFSARHAADAQAAPDAARVTVQGVANIDVAQAHALSTQGVTVIDVREPHEYQAGHVPGARNLPLGKLGTWAPELDPEGSYVLICRSGKRSAKATQDLEAKGFKNLRNVSGGMLEWEAQQLPVSRPQP